MNGSDKGVLYTAMLGAVAHNIESKTNGVIMAAMELLDQLTSRNDIKASNKGEYISYVEKITNALLEKVGDSSKIIAKQANSSLLYTA